MSLEERKKLTYYIACAYEFAAAKSLSPRQAITYLLHNGGFKFLVETYEAEHQLSFDDAVDDLTAICAKNGGLVT